MLELEGIGVVVNTVLNLVALYLIRDVMRQLKGIIDRNRHDEEYNPYTGR